MHVVFVVSMVVGSDACSDIVNTLMLTISISVACLTRCVDSGRTNADAAYIYHAFATDGVL